MSYLFTSQITIFLQIWRCLYVMLSVCMYSTTWLKLWSCFKMWLFEHLHLNTYTYNEYLISIDRTQLDCDIINISIKLQKICKISTDMKSNKKMCIKISEIYSQGTEIKENKAGPQIRKTRVQIPSWIRICRNLLIFSTLRVYLGEVPRKLSSSVANPSFKNLYLTRCKINNVYTKLPL